ncbi:MAG: hypothetical protein ABI652_01540 [Acidobacteriota bacterium]
MRKQGLGLLLVLTLLIAAGATFQNFRFDKSFAQDRAAAISVERQLGSMEVAVADVRAAETGYLAAGQGPEAWMRRATELFETLSTTMSSLRSATVDADARMHYDAAETALNALVAIDKRARDNVRSDQRFIASDLVFVDGVDASKRLTDEIAAARTAESAAAADRLTQQTRTRTGMNALALGLVTIFGFISSRLAMKVTRPAPASEAATMAQMLRDLPPAVKTATPGGRLTPSVPNTAATGSLPAAAPLLASSVPPTPPSLTALPPASLVNLPEAADLCIDLARVVDERDMPALLERAANVLEAKGVIVWIADRAGQKLRPSLTHGYPDKVIVRLGMLDVDSDNVTSLAFRSMQTQTMNGGGGNAGAVAIPLMTSTGCAGVLAAEIRDSRPAGEMIAVARIIAAQLSVLVGSSDAASDARVAQA